MILIRLLGILFIGLAVMYVGDSLSMGEFLCMIGGLCMGAGLLALWR